jgi:hypothetical protein
VDSIEQQVTDKLESAFLFASGDDPIPQEPTIADPMKVQAFETALRQEMGDCIKLLAREIDALKARLHTD